MAEYEYLKKYIKEHPEDLEMNLNLGEICISMGLTDEAEEYFRKVVDINPVSSTSFCRANNYLGHILLNTGRFDEALAQCKMSERAYPREGLWELQAHISYDVDDYNTALKLYNREIITPSCTDPFVGQGDTYQVMGKPELARGIYTAGTAFEPDEPFVYGSLCQLLISQGELDLAEKMLREGIEREPAYGDFYIFMGDLEFRRNSFQKAIDYYNNALRVDPRRCTEPARAGLGKAYLKMAEKDYPPYGFAVILVLFMISLLGSCLALRKLQADKPGKEGSLTDLRRIFVPVLIILFFTSLVIYLYKSGSLLSMKILTPQKASCYEKARKNLISALNINPRRKDLRESLALVYEKTGDNRRAMLTELGSRQLPPYTLKEQLKFNYP